MLPTLLGVMLCVFVLMRVVPGDPVAMMAGPGASVQDFERLRVQLGLDQALPVQFVHWVGGVLSGDWGESLSVGRPVLELVAGHLPATLELVLLTLLPACIGALAAALVLARSRARWIRWPVGVALGIAQGVPDFLWALLLMLALGVWLPVLPVSGRSDPALSFDFLTGFHLMESLLRGQLAIGIDLVSHMILPALALALPFGALLARVLTFELRQALAQPYSRFARAQGLTPWTVMHRAGLRNAWGPVLAFGGVQLVFLMGGTVLIEQTFGYPGIGRLTLSAVTQRDLPLVQALVLVYALLFLTLRLLIDVLILMADPRLRMNA